MRGQHKPELVDLRMLQHMIGNNQMTDMNGIKRAEVETDVHGKGEKLNRPALVRAASFRKSPAIRILIPEVYPGYMMGLRDQPGIRYNKG